MPSASAPADVARLRRRHGGAAVVSRRAMRRMAEGRAQHVAVKLAGLFDIIDIASLPVTRNRVPRSDGGSGRFCRRDIRCSGLLEDVWFLPRRLKTPKPASVPGAGAGSPMAPAEARVSSIGPHPFLARDATLGRDARDVRGRVVVQDRRQPALRLADGPALAARIVLDLVALDLRDAEIMRVGMREIEAATRSPATWRSFW